MASIVTRDNKPVSPVLADENAAHRWLQQHQGMSNDWAMRQEGYAIVDAVTVDPADIPPGRFAVKVDGEEIDHADTLAQARTARETIIYGGIGTEASTTIERRDRPGRALS